MKIKRVSLALFMCNGHLNHTVQLVLEQVICLGDVGEFVAVRNQ